MHGSLETMRGHVTIHDHGAMRLHDYTAPQDGLLVHSLIVEGPNQIVLFDAQFLLAYAEEVADYIARLGKPLARIIISHIHPDHWSGLAILARRFPETPIAALAGVRDYIERNGQAIMTARQTVFGEAVAATAMVPQEVITPGEHVIDGIRYRFEAHDEGESQHQLVAFLSDQATLLAFDLVFPRNVHVFTVAPFFDHWAAILRHLDAQEFDTLLVGHAGPATRADIAATIDYLGTAREIHARTASPEDYAARIKARFPGRAEPGWVDFASLMLYGVINP
ncbi:MAG: MBL fold metallo-hydrolase [Proteobacteria bacterium]|nr:MBL fold metallo-hydrolase [Pseudomonadota bacterium]